MKKSRVPAALVAAALAAAGCDAVVAQEAPPQPERKADEPTKPAPRPADDAAMRALLEEVAKLRAQVAEMQKGQAAPPAASPAPTKPEPALVERADLSDPELRTVPPDRQLRFGDDAEAADSGAEIDETVPRERIVERETYVERETPVYVDREVPVYVDREVPVYVEQEVPVFVDREVIVESAPVVIVGGSAGCRPRWSGWHDRGCAPPPRDCDPRSGLSFSFDLFGRHHDRDRHSGGDHHRRRDHDGDRDHGSRRRHEPVDRQTFAPVPSGREPATAPPAAPHRQPRGDRESHHRPVRVERAPATRPSEPVAPPPPPPPPRHHKKHHKG
jgi:hypothetical protein